MPIYYNANKLKLLSSTSVVAVASWDFSLNPTLPSFLTHSRTSLATMFDSTGKLTYAPNNLLTYSNTFSNAAWIARFSGTGSAPVLTSGQSDPFGGTSAWRVQFNRGVGNTTSDYSDLYQNFTSGPPSGVNLASGVWIKSNTGLSQNVYIATYNGTTFTSVGVTATTSWQFIPQAVFASGGAASNYVYIGSRGTYNSTNSVDVLIYAYTASAVTYETTPRPGDQVITTAAAYYGPRIDYDPNTLAVKGLLIEEARTNLTIRSGELTHWVWGVSGLTRGTDGTLDLTGATAVKLSATVGSAPHNIYNGPNISITSGSTYSVSWFVKGGTHTKVLVNSGDGINYSAAVFDISGTADGTATQIGQSADTAGAGTSKYIGNGWFRLTLKFTAGANGNRFTVIAFVGALTGNVFNGYGDVLYPAAGTETIYIGQPQFEPGSSATSYIPTAASSVTRAADVVQFTGPALTALQGSAGSAIVEMQSPSTTHSGAGRLIGSTSSRAILYAVSDTVVASWNGSRSLNATIGGSGKFSTIARSGVAWSAAGTSVGGNGGTIASDGNAAFGGVSPASAYLGSDAGTASFESGWYRSFAIYNQRLSDATLQAKSVVGAAF